MAAVQLRLALESEDADAILSPPYEGHFVDQCVELLRRKVVVVQLAWLLEDEALRV